MMFGHDEEQKARFAKLNERTRTAMMNLQDGRADAMSVMTGENIDPDAATKPFLQRIQQIGNLDSLHVVGTFANNPGSWFYESGPWTTFVYAEFKNWNQYWNMVWNDDEMHTANLQGPWPSFTLIPAGENSYAGVQQIGEWNTIEIEIRDDCLHAGSLTACKITSSE